MISKNLVYMLVAQVNNNNLQGFFLVVVVRLAQRLVLAVRAQILAAGHFGLLVELSIKQSSAQCF